MCVEDVEEIVSDLAVIRVAIGLQPEALRVSKAALVRSGRTFE